MIPQRKSYKVQLKLDDVDIVDVSLEYKEDASDIPTLRDICVLLYKACGHGVLWNLAYELSKKLKTPYYKIALILDDIIEEYAEMSYEEGIESLFNKPKPPEKYFSLVEKRRIDEYLKNKSIKS